MLMATLLVQASRWSDLWCSFESDRMQAATELLLSCGKNQAVFIALQLAR